MILIDGCYVIDQRMSKCKNAITGLQFNDNLPLSFLKYFMIKDTEVSNLVN